MKSGMRQIKILIPCVYEYFVLAIQHPAARCGWSFRRL